MCMIGPYYSNMFMKHLQRIKDYMKLGWKNSPLCILCNVEDSNMHRFDYCMNVQECFSWIRKYFFYLCGMNIDSLLKILSLDLPKVNIKVKNTLCIIISSYITRFWFTRDKSEWLIVNLKAKIIRDQKIKLKILKDKAKKVFTENYTEGRCKCELIKSFLVLICTSRLIKGIEHCMIFLFVCSKLLFLNIVGILL